MKSPEALKLLLMESGIPLASETGLQLRTYLALLEKWNVRVNLTSSTEWRVIGPMFREGIWASKFYSPSAVAHLDIGSGAGFPALLLKMLNPQIELELVESREKKGQFLETAAHALGLSGIQVHHARLCDYLRRCEEREGWDCISWKALRLSTEDLLQLHARGRGRTEFWMFHGLEPAVEAAEELEKNFDLVRTERVPCRRDSNLSIYRPRWLAGIERFT